MLLAFFVWLLCVSLAMRVWDRAKEGSPCRTCSRDCNACPFTA